MSDILGQESEQGNQPGCPRAGLELKPNISLWCQLETGRLLWRAHTHSSCKTKGKKLHILSSNSYQTACLHMVLRKQHGAASCAWEMPPHKNWVLWMRSIYKETQGNLYTSLLPTLSSPDERKRMSSPSTRRGDLQSISRNKKRDVGRKTVRWQCLEEEDFLAALYKPLLWKENG